MGIKVILCHSFLQDATESITSRAEGQEAPHCSNEWHLSHKAIKPTLIVLSYCNARKVLYHIIQRVSFQNETSTSHKKWHLLRSYKITAGIKVKLIAAYYLFYDSNKGYLLLRGLLFQKYHKPLNNYHLFCGSFVFFYLYYLIRTM